MESSAFTQSGNISRKFYMRKTLSQVAGLLLLSASLALAQNANTRIDGVAFNRSGLPAAGATIAVCSQVGITAISEAGNIVTVTTALNPPQGSSALIVGVQPVAYNGTYTVLSSTPTSWTYFNPNVGLGAGTAFGANVVATSPCAPAANLCVSLSDLSCGATNPFNADGLGNYNFYIATGTVYTLEIFGSGLTARFLPDQLAGGGGTGSGGGGTPGLTDPGNQGIVFRTTQNNTRTSSAADVITLFGGLSGCLPNQVLLGSGLCSTVANNSLTNSTLTLSGTTNQVTGPGTVNLGGTGTFAIANPFVFPGKATTAASALGSAGFNLPSGPAPTSPVAGDLWNNSGVLQYSFGGITSSILTGVGLTLPAEFSVAGSPVTGATGTLAVSKATQTANTVWRGPTSGAPAVPIFGPIVPADLPVATAQNVGGTLACPDSSGSGTAESCSTNPSFTPSYSSSAPVCLDFTTTTGSTGALTLNVNSTSALTVQHYNGNAIANGDIKPNVITYICLDNASHWRLQF